MGSGQRVVGVTGFVADTSETYLHALLQDRHQIIRFGSNMTYVDAEKAKILPEFDIVAGADPEQLQKDLLHHALKLVAKDKPVIVFGLENVDFEALHIHVDPDIVLHTVDTDGAAERVPSIVASADRIIVFVSWQYYFGLDMKFDGEAEVVVYANKYMDYETLFQCFGRGARKGSNSLGTLFMCHGDSETMVRAYYSTHKGPDFRQGARIMKACAKVEDLEIKKIHSAINHMNNTRNPFFDEGHFYQQLGKEAAEPLKLLAQQQQ